MNKRKFYYILFVVSVFLISCSSSNYLYRIIFWNYSGIDDCNRFPSRLIQSSDKPFYFDSNSDVINKYKSVFDSISYSYKGKIFTKDIDALIAETQTTAFIVIKDDCIIIEKYANGYSRDSVNRSFSVAKSITSALIGIAIDKRFIKSIDESICDYLTELDKKKYGSIQIKHLLSMQSGIKFSANGLPLCDDVHLYYEPDARNYALSHLKIIGKPGEKFLYNNYCTLLLAIILERASKMSITEFTQKYLWSAIGTEYQATWSINRKNDGLEQVASGFNARAIDFAKIGRLYLKEGNFEGTQVLVSDWINQSIKPPALPDDYFANSEMGKNIFYGYQWWGHHLANNNYNFFASGHLGQLIYVCPSKKIIICRFGKRRGNIDVGWHIIARWICDRM